mmetsp:Transcript_5171/g.7882  ORF Transcript_5171/g.7882 Transcript_5171/m.7882 type:complete len:143 (-) Transcript_5171:1311-1739(-)
MYPQYGKYCGSVCVVPRPLGTVTLYPSSYGGERDQVNDLPAGNIAEDGHSIIRNSDGCCFDSVSDFVDEVCISYATEINGEEEKLDDEYYEDDDDDDYTTPCWLTDFSGINGTWDHHNVIDEDDHQSSSSIIISEQEVVCSS